MNKFIICKLRDVIKIVIFLIFLSLLLIFSKNNIDSVKDSLNIFLQNVFPSLFPFILFTNIVLNTDIPEIIDKFIGKYIENIFKVKSSSIAIIIGFLCGFPLGAKATLNLYLENKIDYNSAKKLLSFTNNCNPLFVISTIGISMFSSIKIGILFLISQYLSAIIIGIIYKTTITNNNLKLSNTTNNKIKKDKDNFFNNIKTSIFNTFLSLGTILGFIIIFNLLFSIIKHYLNLFNISNTIICIISSIFEITKGCLDISLLDTNIILKLVIASFSIGFSGFCILCQIYSVISNDNFKFIDILKPKLIQGIISSIITYILIKFTNFFNVDTLTIFNNQDSVYINKKIYINYSLILIIFTICIFFYLKHKKSSHKTTLLKKGGKL